MSVEHIEDLKVFAQAVESGTLAAAGRTLGLAPSIVSRRLARLERALGVRLLQRTTRSLSVTDEGQAFYRRCRRILFELEAAEDEVQPPQDGISGTVRAVVPSSSVMHGFMESLSDLLHAHPQLTIQVRLSDQVDSLSGGSWDVAVWVGNLPDSTHIGRRLCQISPVFAATPDYLALHGTPETAVDLVNHQCLRFGSDRTEHVWPIVDPQGTTHRVPIGGQVVSEDLVASYAALHAGLGIGALPHRRLREAESNGALKRVLPGCHLEPVTLHALMPEGRHRLPRIQVFVDWLAEFMQTLFLDQPPNRKRRQSA